MSNSLPTRARARSSVLALVLTLVCVTVLPAGADTEEDLAVARTRLEELTTQLEIDREAAERMKGQLLAVQEALASTEARYDEIEHAYDRTQDAEAAAQDRFEEFKERLGVVMAEAYMGGSMSMLGFLLSSESQSDFSDRLDLLSAISESNAMLADRATEAADALDERGDELTDLMAEKESILQSLDDQRAQLEAATAAQEEAAERMQHTVDNIMQLVIQLRKQLKMEDIAYLQHAFQGEKSLPYGQWAELFMGEIGAPACRDNLVAMVAWQLNEGTSADWNPLATTYYMPGSSSFNSYSVRDYVSLAQGLDATRLTLEKGSSSYLYKPILASFRRCAPAMVTAEAINASSWCRGCTSGRYVTGLIEQVQANYADYAKL